MQLSDLQIKTIIKNNPTKPLWEQAVRDCKKLQMHVLGAGLQDAVSQIETYESPKGVAIRKKYCKSNRDLFARVLRPIDNIWTGRGGGIFYDTGDANQKRMRGYMQNVYNGFSARAWIQLFWMRRYIDDPMGLVFMEVNNTGPYPTYKASSTIYDAQPLGRRFDYIIFKTDDPAIFRVVDDARDVLVKYESEGEGKLTILNSPEYPQFINWFDQVPAIMCSDIPKDGQDNLFMSPIADEVEMADVFLREGSIANIYRFKSGFPRPWKYPEVCGKCKGTKFIEGNQCDKCNGSGLKLVSEAGEMAVFAWPTSDSPEIKEKAGHTSPDIAYMEYADEYLAMLEELIDRTQWGTSRLTKVSGSKQETATGRFIDIQPVMNRLTQYAKAGESTEEFIATQTGIFYFRVAYHGTAINYGRRFLLANPDDIWAQYQTAVGAGAAGGAVGSISALDDLLRDYYETKYQANPQELQYYLQIMKLEPAVHYTLAIAKTNLPWAEYIKKVYFRAYLTTKTSNYIAFTPLDILSKELQEFAVNQAITAPQDPMAPKLDENNNPIPAKPAEKPFNPVNN